MIFNRHDMFADKIYRKLGKSGSDNMKPYITLYHGSPYMRFKPTFGIGNDKHDYGAGFYTTFNIELAKEWSVCNTNNPGYIHKYLLETKDLNILNLNDNFGIFTWLAILAKHRCASPSKRYKNNADKLVKKYYDPYKDIIESADVIIGYRADDSYFYFAKNVIRNEVDVDILEEIMEAGNLGDQIFIQSQKAFDCLTEVEMNDKGYYCDVDNTEYRQKYIIRDRAAREKVHNIIESDRNTLTNTIENYLD